MALLRVKVKPNAKKSEVSTMNPLTLRIAAAPKEGEANKELVRFLAELLLVPKSAITITKGEAIPFKTLEITGIDVPTIQERLLRHSQLSLI